MLRTDQNYWVVFKIMLVRETVYCQMGDTKYHMHKSPAEQDTEPQPKQEARWTVLCHTCVDTLVVSTFKQSENVAVAPTCMASVQAAAIEECGICNIGFKVHFACTYA